MLHFIYHYLLLVLAVNSAVYFIIGKYTKFCCVHFNGFGKFFTIGIHFYTHAVNNTIFLILIYHKKIIGISNKINIEGLIGNKSEPQAFFDTHIIVIKSQYMFPPYIFIYNVMIIHFTEDLKAHIPVIFPVKIRIRYFLGSKFLRLDKKQYK